MVGGAYNALWRAIAARWASVKPGGQMEAECLRDGRQRLSFGVQHVGRPPVMMPEKLGHGGELIAKNYGRATVARVIGVGPATLRRTLNRNGRDGR